MGETFENIHTILHTSTLEELSKSKEITICSMNNHFFKPEDNVSLFVDIKNI